MRISGSLVLLVTLLATAGFGSCLTPAERTKNYTTCDPTCQKHVGRAAGWGRCRRRCRLPSPPPPPPPPPRLLPLSADPMQVMYFEGFIVLVVIGIALAVGISCMHLIDVPSRLPQPETASRAHQD